MADLVLYVDSSWNSPFVFSAAVTLEEKGLAWQAREVALHEQAHKRPEYRERSITGRVPALAHGDFWLSESSAIVEYLEDVFPSPRVLPEQPAARARARQAMSYLRTEMNPLREDRPTHTMFHARASKPLSPAGAAAAADLERVATALVGGRDTIAGEWSIADAELAFMLHRLILNGDPVAEPLARYAKAQWARPSVRRFVERARPPFVAY